MGALDILPLPDACRPWSTAAGGERWQKRIADYARPDA